MSDTAEAPSHSRPPNSPHTDDNPFVISGDPTKKAAGGETLRMIVVALAIVLFGLTLGVLFVLPKIIAPNSDVAEGNMKPQQSLPQQTSGEQSAAQLATTEEPSIAEDATAETAGEQLGSKNDEFSHREKAQSLLATADEKLELLETKNATVWAPEEMQKARAALTNGEAAYSEQRYKAAADTYRDVISDLEKLETQSQSVLNNSLAEGELALAAGDSGSARAAFEQALLIEPDNSTALAGKERAENLDEVLALVTEAAGFEELGETQNALSRYKSALALDPKTSVASEAIARINDEKREKSYRAAMSRGFNALDKKQYAEAKKHFTSASSIKPGDDNATEALTQANELIKTKKIDSLLASANRKSQQEDWPAVEKSLLEAKRIDNSISGIDARIASARSRKVLNQQLAKYTAEAHRLRTDAVHSEALAIIEKAKGVNNRGPKLNKQIAALEATITAARTPRAVTLTSDAETNVTVYKVGKFGSFSTKNLSLLPGPYIAVGKRTGYRNVRLEFTVSATNASQAFDIRCIEQLKFGAR